MSSMSAKQKTPNRKYCAKKEPAPLGPALFIFVAGA
jgi:hypothetical protein